MAETVHNLDQYMSDLRQILAQGKKRVAILLGAGTPVGINASKKHGEFEPLIPAIEGLTKKATSALDDNEKAILASVIKSIGVDSNIEKILSKIRALSSILKNSDDKLGGYTHQQYEDLGKSICKAIGDLVKCRLPSDDTPYNRLASWIGGTDREHGIEVFTTNYDFLMEEAFEKARIPFFAGFSGSNEPFFDAASISSNDDLPSRWARLWKLHGSLGWSVNAEGELTSGKGRDATELIYPDHLKYEHIQKLPYTALFDRLRKFLMTPDTLLISCGFSYADAHISALINEALSANPRSSVFATLYLDMNSEKAARELARKRPNFSAYARDRAIINCIEGRWELGKNTDNKDWQSIRESFWSTKVDKLGRFTLGDFTSFANFFALSKSDQMYSPVVPLVTEEKAA